MYQRYLDTLLTLTFILLLGLTWMPGYFNNSWYPGIGRYGDVDNGKVLHSEGDVKAKAFRGIGLHRLGRTDGGNFN